VVKEEIEMPRFFASLILTSLLISTTELPAAASDVEEVDQSVQDFSAHQVSYEKNLDWFGGQVGGGLIFIRKEIRYRSSLPSTYIDILEALPVMVGDIFLFNLQFPLVYFTPIEFHHLPDIGLFGVGVRLGMRFPITPDYKHEIRLGSYFGYDFFSTWHEEYHSLSLRPSLQYVYNMQGGSIGLGADIPIIMPCLEKDGENCQEIREDNGHTSDIKPVSIGFLLYFRFTIGRIQL